jgi:hypothetical protein
MDLDPSSPTDSRRSSRSHMTLIVRLKLPPRALAMAASTDVNHLPLFSSPDKAGAPGQQPVASPFPPSSPPTMASSPVPSAVPAPKRRGGPGKRARHGLAPGAGVFSLGKENNAGGAGTGAGEPGSGAGTPAPTTEKERVKPGPKANPGGINAGLRALDRSGKPTRRWQKVQYPVKTCSGYTFYTTTWVAPGMRPQLYCINMLVPGDGLYEERMKTEGGENEWNAQENEKPLEQDLTMGDVDAVIA